MVPPKQNMESQKVSVQGRGNQGKGSSVNLSLPTRTLRPAQVSRNTERISQIPHLQQELAGRQHRQLHSSCCCEEQTSDPLSKERAGLLTSILCGQQSRSRKNHTEERRWGRPSPFYGQKYWKRMLVERSTTTGSDLRMHMGPEGTVRGAGLSGRETSGNGEWRGKQAGQVQDLAKQNSIRGHIMLGPNTSHSKKGPPGRRQLLDQDSSTSQATKLCPRNAEAPVIFASPQGAHKNQESNTQQVKTLLPPLQNSTEE